MRRRDSVHRAKKLRFAVSSATVACCVNGAGAVTSGAHRVSRCAMPNALNSALYAAQHRVSPAPHRCRGPPPVSPPACWSCLFPSPARCRLGAPSFAWFGLVPLLWAILAAFAASQAMPRPLRRGFLLGVSLRLSLVRRQLLLGPRHHGPSTAICRRWFPSLLLIGYSLVLGLYFGFFGLGRRAGAPGHRQHAPRARRRARPLGRPRTRRRPHHLRPLGSARLLPGRQRAREPARALDRRLRHQLCSRRRRMPSLPGGLLLDATMPACVWRTLGIGVCSSLAGCTESCPAASKPATTATAVLDPAQPRRRRRQQLGRPRPVGSPHCRICTLARRTSSARHTSPASRKPARRSGEIVCPPYPTHPDLVVWPESPAPFFEADPRFQQALLQRCRSRRTRRWWWAASAWTFDRRRQPGATTTPPSSSPPTARASAATTKSTLSPSANTSPSSRSALLRPQAHRPCLDLHARRRAQGLPPAHRHGQAIATASSSAMSRSLPTKSASSPNSAPKSSSTSATTAGTATPALPGSTSTWPACGPSKIAAGFCATPTTASPP